MMKAIESELEIKKAMRDLMSRMSFGAAPQRAMGGVVHLLKKPKIWSFIETDISYKRDRKNPSYWNSFDDSHNRFRNNILVEINAPLSGPRPNIVGTVARDKAGRRWILHRGRLHPSSVQITESMFHKVARRELVTVTFSNGRSNSYIPVACIDAGPRVVQRNLAGYVALCRRVREYYQHNRALAKTESAIEDKENRSLPEKRGKIWIGPKSASEHRKVHAYVWHELRTFLEVKTTNARVGKWGPDLRTLVPIKSGRKGLFEIKTKGNSSEIHSALGQLLIYEHLLNEKYDKIIISPSAPKADILRACQKYGIIFHTYSISTKGIKFSKALRKILK